MWCDMCKYCKYYILCACKYAYERRKNWTGRLGDG